MLHKTLMTPARTSPGTDRKGKGLYLRMRTDSSIWTKRNVPDSPCCCSMESSTVLRERSPSSVRPFTSSARPGIHLVKVFVKYWTIVPVAGSVVQYGRSGSGTASFLEAGSGSASFLEARSYMYLFSLCRAVAPQPVLMRVSLTSISFWPTHDQWQQKRAAHFKKILDTYRDLWRVVKIIMWVSYLNLILDMSRDTKRVQSGCVSLTVSHDLTLIFTMSRDPRQT